jgi:4-hydroxybenzoate polyprenyltransferase
VNWTVALRLGRVSNLPTVWTNVIAASALAGATSPSAALVTLMLAMSLCYVAGMYLNDYFDRRIDARTRPERPIPAGEVSARAVAVVGTALLAGGVFLLVPAATLAGNPNLLPPLAAGGALAAAILLYDARHKEVPWAPLVMGGCRALVYVTSALVWTGQPAQRSWIAAATAFLYVAALSKLAAREGSAAPRSRWPAFALLWAPVCGASLAVRSPLVWLFAAASMAWTRRSVRVASSGKAADLGVAIGQMIAGISIVDATIIAAAGEPGWALAALACCGLTRALQGRVSGV